MFAENGGVFQYNFFFFNMDALCVSKLDEGSTDTDEGVRFAQELGKSSSRSIAG